MSFYFKDITMLLCLWSLMYIDVLYRMGTTKRGTRFITARDEHRAPRATNYAEGLISKMVKVAWFSSEPWLDTTYK